MMNAHDLLSPEQYAWDCAEDMRGWAMRADDAARAAREANFALRREMAILRSVAEAARTVRNRIGPVQDGWHNTDELDALDEALARLDSVRAAP